MKKRFLWGLALCLSACNQQKIEQPTSQVIVQAVSKKTISTLITSPSDKEVPKIYIDWLSKNKNQQKVKIYKDFLQQQHVSNIAPDFELLQTARDWQKCNAQAFEIPPQEIWSNIIPTLQILKQLVDNKILDDFTVTSVYRNFNLNHCAGGANSSKHVFNAALDFRIGPAQPSQDDQLIIQQTKDRICKFWVDHGEKLNMGLGVYASGQIHIDSAGYRTWGIDHRNSSSPCLITTSSPYHE